MSEEKKSPMLSLTLQVYRRETVNSGTLTQVHSSDVKLNVGDKVILSVISVEEKK